MSNKIFKSGIYNILDKIQVLYPDYSREQLWYALQDRLLTKYGGEFAKGVRVGININKPDPSERKHKLYEEARQRSDYQDNKKKNRAQLAQEAKDSGLPQKERAQIRAANDAYQDEQGN